MDRNRPLGAWRIQESGGEIIDTFADDPEDDPVRRIDHSLGSRLAEEHQVALVAPNTLSMNSRVPENTPVAQNTAPLRADKLVPYTRG